jgi:deoxyribonuclease-4
MHVSISGGMDRMAERARDFGCEAVQVFSRSPGGGKPRQLGAPELTRARDILDGAGIGPLVVHSPYFSNLASADEGLWGYAVETLTGELERAASLGSPYLITHLGRPAPGVSPEEALDRVAEAAGRALRSTSSLDSTVLLLENTAGSERELGARLEELALLADRLETEFPGRTGVCLDTGHAHAAGYDLSDAGGIARFAALAHSLFGPGRVRVVHANDCLAEAGSHLDRHARIGEGTIGEEGFRALMTEPALRGCPFILETPGSDEERAVDLERLRRLREGL